MDSGVEELTFSFDSALMACFDWSFLPRSHVTAWSVFTDLCKANSALSGAEKRVKKETPYGWGGELLMQRL